MQCNKPWGRLDGRGPGFLGTLPAALTAAPLVAAPALQNGFDGWLAKPFRVEEFARVMGKLLSQDKPAAAAAAHAP